MHPLAKKTLFLFSLGVLGVSVLASIFLSPTAGVMVACGTTIAGLFWNILSQNHDILSQNHDILRQIHDLRVELHTEVEKLAIEITKTKDEFAVSAGLPLVSQYLELQADNCPLFKQAADEIYQQAVSGFELLHRNELRTTRLEEVYHWLEFLFRDFGPLKKIKAVSSGEFNEWRATDSWWIKHYMQLHLIAHEREVQIERIFILKGKYQIKTFEDIFQRNQRHQVQVKLAIHDRISSTDHQMGNCMLFYTESKEPVYALVAHHDNHGQAEEIIIYRDPQKIRRIAEAHARISSVAKLYSATSKDASKSINMMAPRKSA